MHILLLLVSGTRKYINADTLWSFGNDQTPILLKMVERNVTIAVVTRDIQTVCLHANRLYGHLFSFSYKRQNQP
jgi:hypothetical protein